MGAVAFLPEEFGSTQEHTGTHLPAHHIGPLVAEHGQVAPAVYPVLVRAPDNGLGGRAHYQLFFKTSLGVNDDTGAIGVVFKTVVCYHGALLGKAFYVLGLAAQKRFRDKQREVSVLHAGLLEHTVEGLLHLLPNGIAVGLDYHTAAHGALLCKVCLDYQLVIPLRVVFCSFGEIFKFYSHCISVVIILIVLFKTHYRRAGARPSLYRRKVLPIVRKEIRRRRLQVREEEEALRREQLWQERRQRVRHRLRVLRRHASSVCR